MPKVKPLPAGTTNKLGTTKKRPRPSSDQEHGIVAVLPLANASETFWLAQPLESLHADCHQGKKIKVQWFEKASKYIYREGEPDEISTRSIIRSDIQMECEGDGTWRLSRHEFDTTLAQMKWQLIISGEKLEASQESLRLIKQSLEASQLELKASRDELRLSKDLFEASQLELKTSQDELAVTKRSLEALQLKLAESIRELETTKITLDISQTDAQLQMRQTQDREERMMRRLEQISALLCQSHFLTIEPV